MVIGIDTEQPVLSDSLGLLILLEQPETTLSSLKSNVH